MYQKIFIYDDIDPYILKLEGSDAVNGDGFWKFTHSTSEDNTYRSKISWLQKPTQRINADRLHQLISRPWQIFISEGLDTIWEIDYNLYKQNLHNSSSCDFEKFIMDKSWRGTKN